MLLLARLSENKSIAKAAKDKYPTMSIIGIYGPLNVKRIITLAQQEEKELIVMGKHSPAFQNTETLLQESLNFMDDKSLVLVFEKLPIDIDPLYLDPLIIVRRSFLLDIGANLKARSLGSLAVRLTAEVTKRNLKFSYI